MNKFKRVFSFILAMILTISSLNLAYADGGDTNTSTGTGGDGGGSSTSYNSGDNITVGYKIELLFLDLDDEIYSMKPSAEKSELVKEAWNNAKSDSTDTTHNGAVIEYIGNPLYLTNTKVISLLGSTYANHITAKVFPDGDSVYGLGDRTDTTGIDREDKKRKTETLQTYNDLKSKASSLAYENSTLGSVIGNYTSAYELPVFFGKASIQTGDFDQYWQDFFTALRPEVNKSEYTGKYVARPTLCALINYISTQGGANDDFIYFKDVYVNDTEKVVHPGLPDSVGNYNPNCYDTGVYNGKTGAYKIIFEPVYRVDANGYGPMFLTVRDFLYVAEQQAEALGLSSITSYVSATKNTVISNQPDMFKQLVGNFALSKNDIWGLTSAPVGSTSWGTLTNIVDELRANRGGGLAIFENLETGSEIDNKGQPLKIASISHVFLPGSLSSSQKDIQTANMEYIGSKSDSTSAIETALNNVAIQLAKAISGGEVSASDNILSGNYTNSNNVDISGSPLNEGVLLNGQIKLPGLRVNGSLDKDISGSGFTSTLGYAKENQSALIAELEKVIDSYTSSDSSVDSATIRQGIKDIMKEELGIDFTNPNASINMQDFNLAVYLLARYQLDGVEANEEGWNSPTSSVANKWKQILVYQAMLLNEKSKNTVKANESGAWTGPLSITSEDIEHFANGKSLFGTTPLGDTYTSNSHLFSNYALTSEGAEKAVKDGLLDNKENGQISQLSISGNLVKNKGVWNSILNAGELDNGFVRVPVALGTTSMYFGSGVDGTDSVNLPKGWVSSATGDITGQVGKATVNETKGYSDYDIKKLTVYDALNVLFKGSTSTQSKLNTTANLDKVVTLDDSSVNTIKNGSSLFQSITTGPSFNASYGEESAYTGQYISSRSLNPFGINLLINTGIANLFKDGITANSTAYGNLLAKNNTEINDNSEDGVVTAPGYIYHSASSNVNAAPSLSEITTRFQAFFNAFKGDTIVLNDALTASTSNNDKSLILAVNNYMLNRALPDTDTSIKTTVDDKAEASAKTPVTNLAGDYGMGYVIWDAAMPVDIQYVTEVNGEIVPLEGATTAFDNGLISNVWYCVPNIDKALELQKYYTVKDKDGNNVTLEVEEAVVKSATVNDATSLKAFYKAYKEAYDSDERDYFSYEGNNPSGSGKVKYYTKRTIFENGSSDKSNVDTYTSTHSAFGGSDALRYIITSGSNVGMPIALDGITGNTVNTIDIVPSASDRDAYTKNTKKNRLQVIVKVRAVPVIKQYNLIEGINGNYVQEVEPVIQNGKVVLKTQIETDNGYASMEAYTRPTEAPDSSYIPVGTAVVLTNKDIVPDEHTTFGELMKSKENNKYKFINSGAKYLIGASNFISDDPATEVGFSKSPTETVDVPSSTRAIYVRYVELPPVYEVYRDVNGNEEVVKKPQVWAASSHGLAEGIAYSLKVSSGASGNNAINSSNTFYPVMAVAGSIDFNPSVSNNVVEIDASTGEKVLNTPTDWQWVLDNITNPTSKATNYIGGTSKAEGAAISNSGISTIVSMGRFKDVQVIGLNGLYHNMKGYPISLTGAINDLFGTGFRKWSRYQAWRKTPDFRDFGYAKSEESITTKEVGDVTVWNSRVADSAIAASPTDTRVKNKYTNPQSYLVTTALKSESSSSSKFPAWCYKNGNDGDYRTCTNVVYLDNVGLEVGKNKYVYATCEEINNEYANNTCAAGTDACLEASGFTAVYPNGYRQPAYAIYILYIEEEEEDIAKNSFYTVLPQDMITRAVAYKDLARQYYQREQVMRYNATKAQNSAGGAKLTGIDYQAFISDLKNYLQNFNNLSVKGSSTSTSGQILAGFHDDSAGIKLSLGSKTGKVSSWSDATIDTGKSKKIITDPFAITGDTLKSFINAYKGTDTEPSNKQEFINILNTLPSKFNIYLELSGSRYMLTDGNGVSFDFTKSEILDYIASELLVTDNHVVILDSEIDLANSKYWRCNFSNWYTIYMTLGDNKARRRDYSGAAKLDDIEFDTATKTGTPVEFGPKYEEINGASNPYLKSNTGDNASYITLDTVDGEEVEKITRFHSYMYSGNAGKNIGLADFGKVVFGILSDSDSTPATVGNVEDTQFFSSKEYDSTERTASRNSALIDKSSSEAYWKIKNTSKSSDNSYWADTYHYYDDYNFYIMVWRGMNKPTLASTAALSEQAGVSGVQSEALKDLTANPIGKLNNQTNGFNVNKGGLPAPEVRTRQKESFWVEDMYKATVKMGLKDTSESIATETKTAGYNKLSLINGYFWKYYDGGHTVENIGSYPKIELDNGVDWFSTKNAHSMNPVITTFKGSLIVDSLIDKSGIGDAAPEESSTTEFTLSAPAVYGSDPIKFTDAQSLLMPLTFTTKSGAEARAYVNWYPWVKMRYQTINPDMYYTSGTQSPVETKDAYVLATNQSSMQLNGAIEIGFNRGNGYGEDVNEPNALTIGSTQWSTHANALKANGKGNVLPGGAIYTLTTGSLTNAQDRQKRSKIGVRYWKPYIPSSMTSAIVESNDVGNSGRLSSTNDAQRELKTVSAYKSAGLNSNDKAFNSIIEAIMQTVNNAQVNLHIDGIGNNAFNTVSSSEKGKYTLDNTSKDTSTVSMSSSDSNKGLSGAGTKGNSASLDSITYTTTVMPTYYRVWSDTDGNVYFGWKTQRNEPTISELEALKGVTADASQGFTKILDASESAGTSYVYDKNDPSNLAGVPYGVDSRTRLITNYVRAIDRNLGYTVNGDMPAGNGADANHLLFNMSSIGEFTKKTSGLEQYNDYRTNSKNQKVEIYNGMGNGLGNVPNADSITTYTALVNKFKDLDKSNTSLWGKLTSIGLSVPSAMGSPNTSDNHGRGIGYKWLTYNSTANSSRQTSSNGDYAGKYSMKSGWYNEASDGFGIVSYGAIVEVGLGYPSSQGSSTPVRTSLIYPKWQLAHTTRQDLFTNNRAAYFYVEPKATTNFVANMEDGTTSNVDYSGSENAFIGIRTSNGSSIKWLTLDEYGLGRLYRSRTFYIGNGSVMDLN